MCYYKPNKPPCSCSFLQLIRPCKSARHCHSSNSNNPNPVVRVCGRRFTAKGVGQRICLKCNNNNKRLGSNISTSNNDDTAAVSFFPGFMDQSNSPCPSFFSSLPLGATGTAMSSYYTNPKQQSHFWMPNPALLFSKQMNKTTATSFPGIDPSLLDIDMDMKTLLESQEDPSLSSSSNPGSVDANKKKSSDADMVMDASINDNVTSSAPLFDPSSSPSFPSQHTDTTSSTSNLISSSTDDVPASSPALADAMNLDDTSAINNDGNTSNTNGSITDCLEIPDVSGFPDVNLADVSFSPPLDLGNQSFSSSSFSPSSLTITVSGKDEDRGMSHDNIGDSSTDPIANVDGGGCDSGFNSDDLDMGFFGEPESSFQLDEVDMKQFLDWGALELGTGEGITV